METLVGITCGLGAVLSSDNKTLIPVIQLGLTISSMEFNVETRDMDKEILETLWIQSDPGSLEYYAEKFTQWAKDSRKAIENATKLVTSENVSS
jgi:hypothetical protein